MSAIPAVELVNLKTKQVNYLPTKSINHPDLKQSATNLSLWETITKGIIQVTRIN